MIAQPVISTPGTPPQANPQAQPQASTNGFLALLAPDNTSLLTSTPANTPPAATPANSNKPSNSNNGDNGQNATPYVNAPVQSTIIPTGNQTNTSTASTSDAAAALAANANQLGLDGNAIPSNAVLPGSNPQGNGANGTGAGNSTDFGADVSARIASGAPIYASQPTASMATVPPHLLNAASQDQPGMTAKTSDADTQKPGADIANEPLPASNVAGPPTAPTLHPSPIAGDQSQTDAANGQDNSSQMQAATANSANAAGNGGDASAASAALAAQPNAPVSAPAQTDAAVHAAAPYVPVGEQVALNLKQALTADNNQIRIQLKPASLGTIDVKLNLTQDGRVSAVISADRSDTLNMLKQDSGTLQQSLRDAGLNADGNSLSFGLRGDAQSFAQNSSQGGFGRGGSNSGNSYATAGADGLSTTGSTMARQSYHDGSLDIEV